MQQPDTLRADEDVIEEFSVSRKYTIVLAVIGTAIILFGIVAILNRESLLDAVVGGMGTLGPLLVLLVGLAAIGLGLYLIVLGIYFQIGHDFFLTSQRVVESVGFLSRRELSTEYRQINDLIVRQDFINKLILGTGTLAITTPGTAGEEFKLLNIDNPVGRRDLLRQLIRADLNGQESDRYVVAHAEVEGGLASSGEEALQSLNGVSADSQEEAKAVVQHEQKFHHGEPIQRSEVAPQQPPTLPPLEVPAKPERPPSPPAAEVTDEVEDLHGDGIDASDRLRAAQRRLRRNEE